MSKVAIEGNASGTGTFTIASPNSNTNYTLTLPTETGTLVTTGITSGLDASALTTGTVNSDRLPTVPVSKGGTGATSLTANNVLLGNGTSALQVVAPGSSGNVLTSNGSTWTSAAAPSPAPTTTQVLDATAGASVGAKGTYAFCRTETGGARSPGNTLAGGTGNLRYADADNNDSLSPATSGTWRIMGYANNQGIGSLWLRIS